MEKQQPTTLKFKEGYILNYYQAFYDRFGGKLENDSYQLNKNGIYIDGTVHEIIDEVQLSLVDTQIAFPIRIDRTPDNNPEMLHLVLIKEGGYSQAYQNQLVNLEADSTKGVFFYNGLFPLAADFPANASYKSIAFKFSKTGLKKILPEATTPINQLFGNEEGVAYHIPLPTEVNRLMEDIFSYSLDSFGSKAMIRVRGQEILITLLKVMIQMEHDDLNGLHTHDYQRIMMIKNRLLSSLNDTINVEEIAHEFGVSVSKLNRDFNSLFNTSIYKFYTYAKIDEAYRRLKTGKYSVSEVSYDMGYTNPAKFSSMFKKLKGIPPVKVIPL
ncbi:helix-turn-helix domain-containing protein [Carboxylicivirga linearis]|uniref:Helix-turn-helix transcriptional regulator n=1 Tax=Carboxylicivirga linearis TaxID=1628157 RepID=A0ABS5K064_9BACT|nr:AraC family transcriptional regulator [Carboxylicivirga linearis]MBS2100493.1 helix-turn-helix transcriptional regulator [Carboxylicivirga linearis]